MNRNTRRAVICANGELDSGVTVHDLRVEDLVIAADGGIRHIYKLGMQPSVVIGDMDSAPNELVQIASSHGAQIVRHPVDKDMTDLELALDYAVDQGCSDITVLAAMGGRIDHELANVFLLSAPKFRHVSVRLMGAGPRILAVSAPGVELSTACEIILIQEREIIQGQQSDIVTLLPLGSDVNGITTEGLQFPLAGDTLTLGSSRGVSNKMTADECRVQVESGILLVVHLLAGGRF